MPFPSAENWVGIYEVRLLRESEGCYLRPRIRILGGETRYNPTQAAHLLIAENVPDAIPRLTVLGWEDVRAVYDELVTRLGQPDYQPDDQEEAKLLRSSLFDERRRREKELDDANPWRQLDREADRFRAAWEEIYWALRHYSRAKHQPRPCVPAPSPATDGDDNKNDTEIYAAKHDHWHAQNTMYFVRSYICALTIAHRTHPQPDRPRDFPFPPRKGPSV